MKYLLSLLGLCTVLLLQAQSQKKKVLFIGNSYTYTNNLPQMIADIALSKGDTLLYDSNTPGGMTISQHWYNATTLSKIRLSGWDHVVLQGQSQEPSFQPANVQGNVYPYAQRIGDSIRKYNPCAEFVFFMTWGYQNGDASNCPIYPVICTYDGQQMRLRESYMEMGRDNRATVSPVGVAWKKLRQLYPGVNPYSPDQSHPSVEGTYLAACVFYSTLFKKSSVGSSYNAGLSSTVAANMQQLASTTVLDSLELWNVGSAVPTASFSSTAIGGPIQFNNLSKNATNYLWDFGDGQNSTQANPQHTYASAQTYTVKLAATNTCSSTVYTKTVQTLVTSITETETNFKEASVYPNPFSDRLQIRLDKADLPANLDITNILGQTVLSHEMHQPSESIDVSGLTDQLYIMTIRKGPRKSVRKLMRQ